jgi:hypothetical protein
MDLNTCSNTCRPLSRHTSPAQNTIPVRAPNNYCGQYKLITEYELPPPPPASPPASTYPSHHDKVVDEEPSSGQYTHSGKEINEESISGLYAESHDKVVDEEPSSGQYTHSGKEINEESISGLYAESQTSAHSSDISTSDILATVYKLLQGADQNNLCSKDILQAAMTELSSVTWLLHSAIQQRNHQSQPEQSPHPQSPEEYMIFEDDVPDLHEEYMFFNVMPETQDSRYLQSPRGGGHNQTSHISALQF